MMPYFYGFLSLFTHLVVLEVWPLLCSELLSWDFGSGEA